MDAQTTPRSAVVADDEPEIRALIAEYLVRLGYQVTQAGDGLEALLHVRDLRPSLLILDLGSAGSTPSATSEGPTRTSPSSS